MNPARLLLLLLPATLLIAAEGRLASAAEEGLTFFRIGTGPTATTTYALGSAISAGISKPPGSRACEVGGLCGVPGLLAVAQTTTSSVESLNAMMEGDLESALVMADIAYWAYHGRGPVAGLPRIEALRVIANLMPLSVHLVVSEDSPFTTINDLRNKRIAIGTEGSSVRSIASNILRVHGVARDQFEPVSLEPGPSADALAAGQIDAFFLLATSPDSIIEDLQRVVPIRILPIEGYSLQQMFSLYPFINSAVIPAADYGLAKDVSVISLNVQWVTLASQPDDLIEEITQALWRSDVREIYQRNNPRSAFADPAKARESGGIPLHTGAREFYDRHDIAAAARPDETDALSD